MCIVLVLVVVRFGLWTMMAELCFSLDDFIVFFSSNFSNSSSVIASCFLFQQFQQNSSGNRKRIRQLRAPSLLDSSGLVSLLLLPAPRQAGRACYALCILFSYSLLCALLRGRRWQSCSVFRWMISLIPGTNKRAHTSLRTYLVCGT